LNAYPHLLAPGQIGPMKLRNRIIMAPMGDRLADDDGRVSERQTAYLEARARGGAGLVLIGSASVAYPAGSYAPCQTAISHDRYLPGLTTLAERVHAHGSCIGVQLVHDGANALYDIAQGRPLLVPSVPPRLRLDELSSMVTADELTAMTQPFTTPESAMSYRVADADDIAEVIEQFADAARRAVAAGFDGIEIHAGHGYLIDSFLSPAANRRDDEWGGDPANRSRLLTEVLRAVRAAAGDAAAVWCRLNAVERFTEGGESPDDLAGTAARAIEAGAQALSISAATNPGAALGVTEAHTPHQPGLLVEFAARLRPQVGVPVITVGRIEPTVAEQALADGRVDFVAMGRKLLADPDLPAKLAAGREDDIRPCIYQYRCIGNIFLNQPVGCVANPATAHGDQPDLAAAAVPRRVLVVGGGPAGLEVARLAARRGHQVVLADQGAALGGTLRLAATTDATLDQFLGWLVHQVEAEGVDLALATTVTPALAASLAVDHVVVATGGSWPSPPVIDAFAPGVRSTTELGPWLVEDDGSVTGPVAVLGGGKAGLAVAGVCARRGLAVTVIDAGPVFAPELGPPGRFRFVHDTRQLGVELVGGAMVTAVGADGVVWTAADGTEQVLRAQTVILTEVAAGGELAVELAAGPGAPSVHVVGDARQAAGIEGAMADAWRVAALLD
jgi:2,4-dienoyl-CoA reductase-like NADH-dependent reductase (Old Yellow Enzyme family)